MNKYIQNIQLNKPKDFVNLIMDDFLRKNEYTMAYRNGEKVYYAGSRFLESYENYLKWSYDEGIFHLEAWIEGFWGLYKFSDFEGIFTSFPHTLYKTSLKNLIAVLQQPLPSQYPASFNVSLQMADNYITAYLSVAYAMFSVVYAMFSILFSVITVNAAYFPVTYSTFSILFSVTMIIPLGFGILGLKYGRLGSCSSKVIIAKFGRICSIIGICLSLFFIYFNALYFFINYIN